MLGLLDLFFLLFLLCQLAASFLRLSLLALLLFPLLHLLCFFLSKLLLLLKRLPLLQFLFQQFHLLGKLDFLSMCLILLVVAVEAGRRRIVGAIVIRVGRGAVGGTGAASTFRLLRVSLFGFLCVRLRVQIDYLS